jgi:hypothetical protein
MTVTVDCSRLVDRQGRAEVETLTLPDGATAGLAVEALGFPKPQADFMIVLRGEKRLQKFTRLADGDRLEIAVPLGGG